MGEGVREGALERWGELEREGGGEGELERLEGDCGECGGPVV